MDPISVSESRVDDLFVFELGVLANTLMWHYDQAMFAVDKQQRLIAWPLIERIRAKAAYLSSSSAVSLNKVLDGIQNWLRRLDDEDFYETMETELHDAATRSGENEEPTGSTRYHEEMRLRIQEFRDALNQSVVDSFLTSPRHRWLFDVGLLIDSGRHPRNVAEKLFGFVEITKPPANSTSAFEENPFYDLPESKPALRTFCSGDLPPETGWKDRIQEVVHTFTSVRLPDEQFDLSSPAATANTVETIQNHIRQLLNGHRVNQSTVESPAVEPPQPVNVPNLNQLTAAAASASEVEATAKEAKSEANENWIFLHHEVQYKALPPIKMQKPDRELLRCLLEHSQSVSCETLTDWAWGPNSSKGPEDLKPRISNLRKQLRSYVKLAPGVQFPTDPIPCQASGRDLCYQIDNSLR